MLFWVIFLVFFLSLVFDSFFENMHFDLQITVLCGPRASCVHLKKLDFLIKKVMKKQLQKNTHF